MYEVYPKENFNKEQYSLQSYLYGHRMKDNQTLYEYFIEFLQVMLAEKTIGKSEKTNEYFPINENIDTRGMSYKPRTAIALKRFVFFENSKIKGKVWADKWAYDRCNQAIEESIVCDQPSKRKTYRRMIQNLIYGFNTEDHNRSWFDKNLMPISEEFVLSESMGVASERKKIKKSDDLLSNVKLDAEFSYNRYTYMRRGGEIYYLHLLNSINKHDKHYGEVITKQLQRLLNNYPQISMIAEYVNDIWDKQLMLSVEDREKAKAMIGKKELSIIPVNFERCGKFLLTELENFLTSEIHPFKKMELLVIGIILQLLRAMYVQTGVLNNKNSVWVVDINNPGNMEMKKLAKEQYMSNEQDILDSLYNGYKYYEGLGKKLVKGNVTKEQQEKKAIDAAKKDTINVFRKLGKLIGLIIPVSGPGTRFSLSEKVIKFLVSSCIEPEHKVTLDTFLDTLYRHYHIVIGSREYKIEMEKGNVRNIGNLSFLEKNKEAFAQKLKECGFLRDLSDATAIVENPYLKED